MLWLAETKKTIQKEFYLYLIVQQLHFFDKHIDKIMNSRFHRMKDLHQGCIFVGWGCLLKLHATVAIETSHALNLIIHIVRFYGINDVLDFFIRTNKFWLSLDCSSFSWFSGLNVLNILTFFTQKRLKIDIFLAISENCSSIILHSFLGLGQIWSSYSYKIVLIKKPLRNKESIPGSRAQLQPTSLFKNMLMVSKLMHIMP